MMIPNSMSTIPKIKQSAIICVGLLPTQSKKSRRELERGTESTPYVTCGPDGTEDDEDEDDEEDGKDML